MKSFSIKEVFGKAWEIWKGHKKVLTLITLFVFVVESFPNFSDGLGEEIFFEVVMYLVGTFVIMGYFKAVLLIEKGERVEFGEIFKHAHYFWRYLFGSILLGLYAVFGLILFIVPGVYFFLKYSFVPLLILDKDMKIGEAFTQSGLMTKGVKWKLLGLIVVSIFVVLLGTLALGIGVFVAMPVVSLANVLVYRKLSQAHQAHSQEAVVA